MTRQMRTHRHKLPVHQRQGRQLQAGAGVSHRDLVVQRKKYQLFTSVPYSNTTGQLAYGLANLNISTGPAGVASSVYARLMQQAALVYEEYRVRRVTVRSQPGLGFTNDLRIQSSIFARVDVNSQPTAATLDNLNSVINSECCVNRTFTERSNVRLADYKPICFSTGGTGASSRPILPNQQQWYNIDERASHLWRGVTVCPVIPDSSIAPNALALTCWLEVEMDFRSRRPDFGAFSLLVNADGKSPLSLAEESYNIENHLARGEFPPDSGSDSADDDAQDAENMD